MYLSCRYLGPESDVQSAEWKRLVNSRGTSKRLAGFNGLKEPFGRHGFSEPDSITNLTVVTSVSSVEAEGEYTCQFVCEEETYAGNVFVTVVGELQGRSSSINTALLVVESQAVETQKTRSMGGKTSN